MTAQKGTEHEKDIGSFACGYADCFRGGIHIMQEENGI